MIEGFFAFSNTNYGHERGQLKNVVKNINSQASISLIQVYTLRDVKILIPYVITIRQIIVSNLAAYRNILLASRKVNFI